MRKFGRSTEASRTDRAKGVVLVLCFAALGCSPALGDACGDNLDCSQNADRICDLTQSGGYCTVQGCQAGTCPDNGLCVAFYPQSTSFQSCNPETEDIVGVDVEPTDDCAPDERCLTEGRCARKTLEQRFCMLRCSSDNDCRSEYICRPVGVQGAEPVDGLDESAAQRANESDEGDTSAERFCVQRSNGSK